MSRHLRKVVRIWWVLSAPPFLIGFVTAWASVACDRLAVMRLGLGCCIPLLSGLYIALGVLLLAAPVVTARFLWRLPGAVRWQYHARRSNP